MSEEKIIENEEQELSIEERVNNLDKEEDCPPCKVNVAIGMILKSCKVNDKKCMDKGHKVLEGEMTVRELAEEVGVQQFIIDALEEEGVPLDEKRVWEEDPQEEKPGEFFDKVNKIYKDSLKSQQQNP